MTASFPRLRPVGAAALLVELGEDIDEEVNMRVIALDRALTGNPPAGLRETVPAYASLLLAFDPLVTDLPALSAHVLRLAGTVGAENMGGREHVVPVSYEMTDAPDLSAVAKQTGLTGDQVVEAHLAGRYRCYMYGFAPGYAYLGGVAKVLHLPRKSNAERGHPAGSIIIAGAQCLITTLPMPTGWWVIGRTPLVVLDSEAERPFRFDPGDYIRFERINAAGRGL